MGGSAFEKFIEEKFNAEHLEQAPDVKKDEN